jgi:2-alkyl-3-oxoalkanoate reductase
MNTAPVLLTGATGFIGRRIQASLLEMGFPVSIISRPGSRHTRYIDPRCEVHSCSLSDNWALRRAVQGARAIVYCAGSVRGRSLDDFLPANVSGVHSILQAQISEGSQSPLLLISSLAASRPELSHYAQSKFLGEQVLRDHSASPWAILRPPAVYGPGDTEMRPILEMVRRGLIFVPGGRPQQLSLLYVDDLASAVLAWLGAWQQCKSRTFSIDDGRAGGYDWPGIAQAAGRTSYRTIGIPSFVLAGAAQVNQLVSKLAGFAPMLTPGKVRELTQPDWLCDNTAFVQETGWTPRIQLASGIRLSLESRDQKT